MTPERWQQVRDVLERALELAPPGRLAFLDAACESDPSLRREVETLLASDPGVPAGFLNSSALADGLAAGTVGVDSIGALQAGQVFAQRFQLIRELGEGGMGQVWLAEQTEPVQRQIALKLIKAGMYNDALVQRFQSSPAPRCRFADAPGNRWRSSLAACPRRARSAAPFLPIRAARCRSPMSRPSFPGQ